MFFSPKKKKTDTSKKNLFSHLSFPPVLPKMRGGNERTKTMVKSGEKKTLEKEKRQ